MPLLTARLAPWLFLATVLLLAPAARGDRRAGVDYARGRAIVSFSAPVADAMQEYIEGRATLAQVCGDDSLSYLLQHFAVSRMERLFDHDDWVIKNREDRTPAQAYWDDVRAVNLRFSDRRARAPTWVHHIATYGIFLLSFPEDQDVFEVCKAFEANPHVAYAESLVTMRLCYTPTDPDWGQLWGTMKINCQSAWDTDKGAGAVVAVLDTGVRLTHDDLKNKLWINTAEQGGSSGVDDDTNGYTDDINGYDFGSGDANPSDSHGHGSHCSGTIGAEEGNSLGIAGVAFLCKIMACKIFGSGGPGDPVVNALNYARVMGADVQQLRQHGIHGICPSHGHQQLHCGRLPADFRCRQLQHRRRCLLPVQLLRSLLRGRIDFYGRQSLLLLLRRPARPDSPGHEHPLLHQLKRLLLRQLAGNLHGMPPRSRRHGRVHLLPEGAGHHAFLGTDAPGDAPGLP